MLAVLLMIAVAVAAALVTYAWTMTYLSSTTSRAGHAVQIQSVDWTSGTAANVYVQNVGDGTLTLTDAYVDGLLIDPADTAIDEGATIAVAITGSWANGDEVHIKVVCDDGTFTEGTYTVEGL